MATISALIVGIILIYTLNKIDYMKSRVLVTKVIKSDIKNRVEYLGSGETRL